MIQLQTVVITLNKMIMPGQTIGIIGGGQLGQMLTQSAKEMGFKVIILDPDSHCSAAQVADAHIAADYDDFTALSELAKRSDVLTYEFENVDLPALEQLSGNCAIPQGTELLRITKDRIREKSFLKKAQLNVVPFMEITSKDELQTALLEFDYPSVLKTCEGGYDGKGQIILHDNKDIEQCVEMINVGKCILEKWLPFDCECSVMVARNSEHQIVTMPVSENIHVHNILHESIVPARIDQAIQQKVQQEAIKIAAALDLKGILGVEFFITRSGEVYVNELAPRPHNSGHYSIEACDHSQFDLHIRAICNWPLPATKLLSPVVMVNILGEHFAASQLLINKHENWHFHYYGKTGIRPGRKMGHITILTDDVAEVLLDIAQSNIWKY